MAIDIENPGADGAALTAALAALLNSTFAGLGVLKGVQQLTASGTITFAAGTKTALIFGIGGGGSGGGVGSTAAPANTRRGGGRGGCGECRAIALSINTALTYTATVGAGGAAPAAGNNSGNPGADTKINNGTSDVFVCKGGLGGAGSPGDTNGSAGAVGTGGTGGVAWGTAIAGGSIPSDTGAVMGSCNTFFGLLSASVATMLDTSAGTVAASAGNSGTSPDAPGNSGSGGWHFNGSVATFAGGVGRSGAIRIFEFG